MASPKRPQATENGANWRISATKLETRHAFAIPVLTPRGAVLDSGSIGQNTGAME